MKTKILVCILAFVMIFALGVMTACGSQGEKGDKGDTGAAGAPGANGADGADGVGIADVKIENGKLVITYTDDTTTELDLPTAEESAACEHKNVQLGALLNNPHYYDYVWNEETEDFDEVEVPGKYVSVCDDCGYAAIVEAFEHSYVETVIPATCTENEYSAKVCLVCFHETDVVEKEGTALDHEFSTHYAEVPGMDLCTEGGMKVDVCAVCDYVEYEMVEAVGHNVASWAVVGAAKNESGAYTWTEGVAVEGLCALGCEVSVELPELDEEDAYSYSEVITVESCATRAGVGTYTIYVDAAGELSATATEGAYAVSFEVAVTGGPHKLNGVLMDKAAYSSATAGISEFADKKATCLTNADGSYVANGSGTYTCDVCKELVLVSTYKEHTYKATDVTAVTPAECETDGLGTVKCSVCCTGDDVVYVVIPATGHTFEYELIEAGEDADGNTIYNVIVTCEDEDYYEVLENVKVTIEDSTCTEVGTITFVTEDGEEIEEEIAKKKHTLNGEEIDPSVPVLATTVGVTEFTDNKAKCDKNGDGTYICEVCGELQLIKTYVPHTFEGELTVERAADCENPGWYEQEQCDECENYIYGEDDVENYIPKLGHHYVYKVEDMWASDYYGEDWDEEDEDYKIDVLNGKCDRVVVADDPETEIDETVLCEDAAETNPMLVVDVKVIKPATCTATGTTVYYGEGNVTVTVTTDKLLHKLNGVEINPAEAILVGTVGLNEFADHPATCTENGQGWYNCDVCGEMQLAKTTKAHTYKEADAVITAPTCDVAGNKHFTCSVCNNPYDEVIPALGHTYKFVVTYAPGEGYTGVATGTCQRVVTPDDPETTTVDETVLCGDNYTEILPALDDEEAEYEVETIYAESCQNGGKYQYAYSFVVDEFDIETTYTVTFTKEVPAIDHTFNGNTLYWIVSEDYTFVEAPEDVVLPFDAEGNPLFAINEDNELEELEDVDYEDEDIVWVQMSKIVWVVTVEMSGHLCDDCDKVINDDIELISIEFKEILPEEDEEVEA